MFGFVDAIDDPINIFIKHLCGSNAQYSNIGKKNRSSSYLKKNIYDNYHIYSDVINECNALDLELYDYAAGIYEKKLLDVGTSLTPAKDARGVSEINRYASRLFRNIVYKNYVRFL